MPVRPTYAELLDRHHAALVTLGWTAGRTAAQYRAEEMAAARRMGKAQLTSQVQRDEALAAERARHFDGTTLAIIAIRLCEELASELAFDEALDDHHYGSGVGDEVLRVEWDRVTEVAWTGKVCWPIASVQPRRPFLSGFSSKTYRPKVDA